VLHGFVSFQDLLFGDKNLFRFDLWLDRWFGSVRWLYRFLSGFVPLVNGYFWLQAYHQEANKANMVKLLAQYLKHPLKNIVVFGDYVNDLGMFQIAGRAIAVANAIPEVKRAAHEIIGSNDHSAVIDYLESLGFA